MQLFDESYQEFYWKNNKIVRQYQLNENNNNNVAVAPEQFKNLNTRQEPAVEENLITGVAFDCANKPTGPNKDPRFCDLYHACVFGRQLKTYSCPQLGERFYYDEKSQR